MKHDREKIYVYGKHALAEALENAPKAVRKVFLSTEAARDEALQALLKKRGMAFALLKGRDAENIVGADASHQGVIATIDPSELVVDFDDFMRGFTPTTETAFVLLDELTDPHNVGAIIRSAAAFGATGVLLPFFRQAPITGAVVKASAGMVFRVPIISIGNINQTVDRLKDDGFRTYGLAMDGGMAVHEEPFREPVLFIVGNEGKGIRQKTLERCDVTLRIPMHARTESLNASVSAAIVLYGWSLKHPSAVGGGEAAK